MQHGRGRAGNKQCPLNTGKKCHTRSSTWSLNLCLTEVPGHFCMVAPGPEVMTVQFGGVEHTLGPGCPGSTTTRWVTLGESLNVSEPPLPHPSKWGFNELISVKCFQETLPRCQLCLLSCPPYHTRIQPNLSVSCLYFQTKQLLRAQRPTPLWIQ